MGEDETNGVGYRFRMLVLLSAIAGYFTTSPGWWWLPASAGMLGQIAHFVSSEQYRRTLQTDGALSAAAVTTALLTVACLAAFAGGRWLAGGLWWLST